jgi:hypothetical protein
MSGGGGGGVEAVDVLKDGGLGVSAGGPAMPPDQLGFDGFEVGFDGGIVVAISFAAHQRYHFARGEALFIVARCVLNSPFFSIWRYGRCTLAVDHGDASPYQKRG